MKEISESSSEASPALAAQRERLSAWMDGGAPTETEAVLARWHGDAELRATWHAYHLIGDVLRSDELARTPRHDESLLQGLRQRLAREPVPMAPAAAAAVAESARLTTPAPSAVRASRWTGGWWAPAAVAAGFMAVAGLNALQIQPESPGSVPMAGFGGGLSAGPVPAAVMLAPPLRESWVPASAAQPGGVIRDARLDRYLERHRHVSGSAFGPMPGAALRAADTVTGEER